MDAEVKPRPTITQQEFEQALRQHRTWLDNRQRGARLQLSGYDLRNLTFTNCVLTEADLSGCDLSGTALGPITLAQTDLSRAVLRGATLRKADLALAKLDGADLTGAELSEANVSRVSAVGALFTKVTCDRTDFTQANLAGSKFDEARLFEANFSNADLTGASLEKATLRGGSFSSARFVNARLTDADLSETSFSSAQFTGADLSRARFGRAGLGHADLSGAVLDGADFYEAGVHSAILSHVRDAEKARHLETTFPTSVEGGARYFESCERRRPERWLDWEALRGFGRLPLFGASYTALVFIPLLLFLLAFYNDKVAVVRGWADKAAKLADPKSEVAALAKTVQDRLQPQPVPSQSMILLGSVVLLAVASTLYAMFCPSRVKEFSKDQWCDQLGRSLLHYWPYSWRYRPVRFICGFCYVVGGSGALWVIGSKVVRAGIYIAQHSSFTFL